MTVLTDRIHLEVCIRCGQQYLTGRKGTLYCTPSCRVMECRSRKVAQQESRNNA